MIKKKVVCMKSSNEPDANGNVFSSSVMKDAVDKIKDQKIPVMMNYDHTRQIGNAELSFDDESGDIECFIEFDKVGFEEMKKTGEKFCAAAAMSAEEIEEKDGVEIIKKVRFTSVGILPADKHVDKNIRPIELD